MAHKLKTRRVPHINQDGNPSKTKMDYRVTCKRRGKVCCDETFVTKREADAYIDEHWKFVSARKRTLSALLEEKRGLESVYTAKVTIKINPDTRNFREVGFTGGSVGVKAA